MHFLFMSASGIFWPDIRLVSCVQVVRRSRKRKGDHQQEGESNGVQKHVEKNRRKHVDARMCACMQAACARVLKLAEDEW